MTAQVSPREANTLFLARATKVVVCLVAVIATFPWPASADGPHAPDPAMLIIPPIEQDVIAPPLPEPAPGAHGLVAIDGRAFVVAAPVLAVASLGIEGPATDASTYTVNVSANYSRSAPWGPIGVKRDLNATDDGIILRLAITSPAAGLHTFNLSHTKPGGGFYAACSGTLNLPAGYSSFVLLCIADNEHDELVVADMKIRPGAWRSRAVWDGVERGAVDWRMHTPGIRVGVHDLIQNDKALLQDVTEPKFWSRPVHLPTWTLRNTGDSSVYVMPGDERGALIQFEREGADYLGMANKLDFAGFDFAATGGTAYAADVAPGARLAINMSWIPGDLEIDPATMRWRGLLRLTPHVYLAQGEWKEVPVKEEFSPGHWIYFYPDSVEPDEPAFATDWSWPISKQVAQNQTAMFDIYQDRLGLGYPANTSDITIYSVRDGEGACGLAAWGVGMLYTNCIGNDAAQAIFIHAMEFHHNIYMNGLFAPALILPGYSGIIEGCAEAGQVAVSQELGLGKDLWTISDFWNELDRDPYGNGYGHVYFMCQMWMDSNGEETNAEIRDAFGALSAYDVYASATGTDARIGAIMWRWYVNDREPGHVPTHPEPLIVDLPEPTHAMSGGSVIGANVPHVPSGRAWIARFEDFPAGIPHTLTVTSVASGFGASEEIRVYGFDAQANGGVGAARIRELTLGAAFPIPTSWTDSPDDRVGLVILSKGDPFFAEHTFQYSMIGTPPCVPLVPC